MESHHRVVATWRDWLQNRTSELNLSKISEIRRDFIGYPLLFCSHGMKFRVFTCFRKAWNSVPLFPNVCCMVCTLCITTKTQFTKEDTGKSNTYSTQILSPHTTDSNNEIKEASNILEPLPPWLEWCRGHNAGFDSRRQYAGSKPIVCLQVIPQEQPWHCTTCTLYGSPFGSSC